MNKLEVNSVERERECVCVKERVSYGRGTFGTRDDYWLILIGKKLRG